MKNKNKSIFAELKDAVSKLPQWVSSHVHVVKKKKHESPFSETTPSQPSHSFADMEWEEFEQLVYKIFKQRGYSVSEKRDGAYDGVDLVLHRGNDATYVQCKQWKEQEIEITAVGELYVAMEVEGIKYGIVITSGVFTSDALDFALGKPLLLINGTDLNQMIDALNSTDSDDETQSEEAEETPKEEMPELEPLCPICSQKMIKRVAKKGKNTGNTFWGCSQFPNCRGVVQDK